MLALVLAELAERPRAPGRRRDRDTGIGQLRALSNQKAGFRLWRIERDYFSPEHGYPADLEENGIPLRDMVWMDQELSGGEVIDSTTPRSGRTSTAAG